MSRRILHMILAGGLAILAVPAMAQTATTSGAGGEPPAVLPPSGGAANEQVLKDLTNQVVKSLSGINAQKAGQPAAQGDYDSLMKALSGLVDKGMRQGKTSQDMLMLIDEALKARMGISLEELARRSGGKLDMRDLLSRLVAKAARNGTASGGDDALIKTLAREGAGVRLAERPVDGGKVITVRPGDTLGSIARRIYGDSSQWKRIYDANRDVIGNPDVITAGSKLRLP